MTTNKWDLSILRKKHNRIPFDCGVDPLNIFLKTLATQHQAKKFSQTTVATFVGENVVRGYYAISSGNVDLSILPEKERKGLPRHPVPVVHLGRLAVCKSVQKQGLGEHLLMHAFERVLRISLEMGIYAIEVVAIDENAVKFYSRYGFIGLEDDKKHLYLPMKVIESL